MYTVTNRVWVDPQWHDTFEERFRRRAGEIDRQPGFVSMRIMRPITEGAPYLVVTVWEDQAAFDAWVGSPDFRAAHANPLPREAFTKGSEMERHLCIMESEAGRC